MPLSCLGHGGANLDWNDRRIVHLLDDFQVLRVQLIQHVAVCTRHLHGVCMSRPGQPTGKVQREYEGTFSPHSKVHMSGFRQGTVLSFACGNLCIPRASYKYVGNGCNQLSSQKSLAAIGSKAAVLCAQPDVMVWQHGSADQLTDKSRQSTCRMKAVLSGCT